MSLYWTFIGPIFPETNIPCFTIMPYSCHHYLATPTFESNYCQKWNPLRVKLEPKYLMSTLRTHWELQLLMSNHVLMHWFLKYNVKHPTGVMLPSFTCKIQLFLKAMMFYYLGMYIFYISDHKLGPCSMILKGCWKGHFILRVIMGGLFSLSVVADITQIMYRLFFFCSSVFISVCVFNIQPKTTLLLPVWLRDAKSLDTPVLKFTMPRKQGN